VKNSIPYRNPQDRDLVLYACYTIVMIETTFSKQPEMQLLTFSVLQTLAEDPRLQNIKTRLTCDSGGRLEFVEGNIQTCKGIQQCIFAVGVGFVGWLEEQFPENILLKEGMTQLVANKPVFLLFADVDNIKQKDRVTREASDLPMPVFFVSSGNVGTSQASLFNMFERFLEQPSLQ